MPKIKLGAQRQIILPATTVKRLGLAVGEELEVLANDKAIFLIPRKYISKDQQWYHTKQWKEMMEEAFDALKQGEVIGPFTTVEEATQALKTAKV